MGSHQDTIGKWGLLTRIQFKDTNIDHGSHPTAVPCSLGGQPQHHQPGGAGIGIGRGGTVDFPGVQNILEPKTAIPNKRFLYKVFPRGCQT